jgi:hypothetical protein
MLTFSFFKKLFTFLARDQMRKISKAPSEWLNLLCHEWAIENQVLVETTDAKFLDYKPYLKGMISSQLLCRLSIPTSNPPASTATSSSTTNSVMTDFWDTLGISDSFDRSYIIAQVRFFIPLQCCFHLAVIVRTNT